jgi:hypothetical protein
MLYSGILTVGPAVAEVLSAAGITERPPAPVEQQLDVVDLVSRGVTEGTRTPDLRDHNSTRPVPAGSGRCL